MLCASLSVLSINCLDDPSSDHAAIEQSSHAVDPDTANDQQTDNDPAALPPDPDQQRFLSVSGTAVADGGDIPIKIVRSKTDKVRMVYGDQVKMSLARLGCDGSMPADTLTETRSGTGVTWMRGLDPDENQNMVKVYPTTGAVEEIYGYGKY